MSSRYLLISTDGHAGLPPEKYKDYVPSKHHDEFDKQLAEQIRVTQLAEKHFLIDEFNAKWRQGIEEELKGAWHTDIRNQVLDIILKRSKDPVIAFDTDHRLGSSAVRL